MKTLAEIYKQFSGVDCLSGSDKGSVHSYIEVYEEIFAPYRNNARRVLEIGLMGGNSLRMWEEYFFNAEVYGVDLCDRPHDGLADLRPMVAEGTHRIAFLNAADSAQVEERFSGMSFDVIIDDANHYLPDQLAIYSNFKDHLAGDGIYVIEDVADIDRDRQALLELCVERGRVFDRRSVKKRFDDVLVVFGGR